MSPMIIAGIVIAVIALFAFLIKVGLVGVVLELFCSIIDAIGD